jgi:pyrroline-5-carboxylate reductase
MIPIIAMIGGGNMGSSLMGGLIASGHPSNHLIASDLNESKLAYLATTFNIQTTTRNSDAVAKADIVVLAVKPQHLPSLAEEIAEQVQQKRPLIISIAAGVRIANMEDWLGPQLPIVRAMPNTPALIGAGAAALFANSHVSEQQRNMAESILRAVGIAVWVEQEEMMDIVTALSGSGPAYFFLMMEALQQAAEELGLPFETAKLLTMQTALGAARMAIESGEAVSELRRQVTSPGGTTEMAINVLEDQQVRRIFKQALLAAKTRSEELAELMGKR